MTAHAVAHDDHEIAHTSGGKYVQIAIVLFLLTAAEVMLYDVCWGSGKGGSVGTALQPHFVSVLLVLSALKFWLVAMFYMHLKSDLKVLTWLFGFSLMIAFVVILALFALFTYNRTLWWVGAPWK